MKKVAVLFAVAVLLCLFGDSAVLGKGPELTPMPPKSDPASRVEDAKAMILGAQIVMALFDTSPSEGRTKMVNGAKSGAAHFGITLEPSIEGTYNATEAVKILGGYEKQCGAILTSRQMDCLTLGVGSFRIFLICLDALCAEGISVDDIGELGGRIMSLQAAAKALELSPELQKRIETLWSNFVRIGDAACVKQIYDNSFVLFKDSIQEITGADLKVKPAPDDPPDAPTPPPAEPETPTPEHMQLVKAFEAKAL